MSTNQPNRRDRGYSAIKAESSEDPYNDGAPSGREGYYVMHFPLDQTLIHNAVMIYFNALEDVDSYTIKNSGNADPKLPEYVNSQYLILEGSFREGTYNTNKNTAYQTILQNRDVNALTHNIPKNAFFKQYKRTDVALWLMMPQSVRFQSNVGWEEVNNDPNAIGLLAQAAANVSSGAVTGGSAITKLFRTLGFEAATNLIDATGSATNLGGAIANSVQNTFNEMAFKGVQRRMFQLSWSLTPRSLAELQEIDTMIQRLRFHAHPAIQSPDGSISFEGSYLDFPGTVDLEWYTRGPDVGSEWEENAWLPRISTCVIHSVETDYSPNGQYAFISNTGAAPQINLSVTLQEVMPLLKSDVARGF